MKPEILAPAGGPDCLPAAVAGGADAVYLGLRHFNARGRAENFRRAELPGHVAYLHRHGLKCYVVLNTLVHDDELPKALDLAWNAQLAGVDAVILQDLGLWHLLADQLPNLPRHASTQMTVHDPSQIRVLAGLGAQRVILARELSLPEIRACAETARACGIEIEHFVHGALCYAFSGQCLISNFAGCRSANRGTCAQNCRFGYRSETSPAYETELSLKDLALIDRVGELADAGVASLKIEGRLKGPDYVYTVAKAYRSAVDAWAARSRTPEARQQLRSVFARTLTEAPLDGDYSAASRLHRADPGRDEAPDAELISLDRARGQALLRSRAPVAAGHGFRVTVGDFTDGFLVTAADRQADGDWRCRVRIDVRGPRLPQGTALFRNRDQATSAAASKAMAAVPLPAAGSGGIPLRLEVSGVIGEPMRALAVAADGRRSEIVSSQALAPARSAPLSEALLAETLGALGGSGFQLERLVSNLGPGSFLPGSLLKDLRRQLVERLLASSPTPPVWEPPALGEPLRRATALWVAVGSLEAARAARDAGADEVWLDDHACDWWRSPPKLPDVPGLRLRLPPTAPLSSHLPGIPLVAGHLGILAAAPGSVADVFLNTYSTRTLDALATLGASAAVLSLELSGREVARLAARRRSADPRLAVVVHGRVPAMLTRQDHGLAPGATTTLVADPREGGLPYELQRRQHDTVVWEGRRLCAPEPARQTLGLVDAWVLELADLPPAAVGTLVAAYRRLREGSLDAEALTGIAAGFAQLGLFPGHLVRGSRELDEISELVAAD